MITMGIDIGSASSKVVILENGNKILAAEVVQIGTGSSGPRKALEQAFHASGLKQADIEKFVATGYGRSAYEDADKQISEISCHAKGVHFLIPDTRTIIDIGGQDAKAIGLDEQGNVKQFFMNDKCAAGTGRFLDVMARVLEVSLDELDDLDKLATEPAAVSSTCTVFAESEVISQLSKGIAKENIIAGIHASVSSKACGLIYRLGIEDTIVMTGGVAKDAGVSRAISKELGKTVVTAPNPQTTGALGAAIYAYEAACRK